MFEKVIDRSFHCNCKVKFRISLSVLYTRNFLAYSWISAFCCSFTIVYCSQICIFLKRKIELSLSTSSVAVLENNV